MIASLSGRLKQRDSGRVVIETGGVGYEVFIPLATYYRLPSLGAPVSLEIRQVVREDSLDRRHIPGRRSRSSEQENRSMIAPCRWIAGIRANGNEHDQRRMRDGKSTPH